MSAVDPRLLGVLLGALFGAGVLLVVVSGPWSRTVDLEARIDPYLRPVRGSP